MTLPPAGGGVKVEKLMGAGVLVLVVAVELALESLLDGREEVVEALELSVSLGEGTAKVLAGPDW